MSRLNRIAIVAILLAVSPVAAPQLLAFPHSATIGQHRVYSEAPIDPALTKIVSQADALAAKSPLASSRRSDQPIFLTSGGWRWIWLTMQNHGTFAISRPVIETIVVNRSNQQRDIVQNGGSIAGMRSLHGVRAHEITHG